MTAAGKQRVRALATTAVGALVVAVVVMMVVPLPTWLLDLLITTNLGLAVVLLLAAAYARDALSIASFPTLLVLTTLYRLGLNVSTVRLILLQADAGRVVRAFGDFVVRGDYVVGFAVFLILTIVQYVVIARGAERVAEVAARFTLDAMPGKQLAIDADLRAGAIDAVEAGRRRAALSREASIYGSLDGAMRFVKGDAIAGILILTISLLGGLAIGVLRRDMALADAARIYTLLTIGDGLASQIPALLLSTAAGLVVTRVSPEEGDDAGADVLGQLVGRPRILLAVAGLLGALALLPGLPLLPFAVVSLLLVGGALILLRRNKTDAALHNISAAPLLPVPAPRIELGVAPALAALPALAAAVEATTARVVDDLGVPLPPVAVTADASLPPGGVRVRLAGASVDEATAGPADSAADFAAAAAAILEGALRRHAADLLGLDETQRLLDALAARAPALCREVVPRRIDLAGLAQLLRRLLAEGLPLGDLREILEAIAALPAPEKDPATLAERVRGSLRRRITAAVAPSLRLDALVIDPLVEETLRESLRGSGESAHLALEPALADDILRALGRELAALDGRAPATSSAPPRAVAILTSPELRRHVRRLVEADHPHLPVVTAADLQPDVQVETVGRIGM